MSRYSYLLFDADDTLFDFSAANHNAFARVCDYCGLTYTEAHGEQGPYVEPGTRLMGMLFEQN